MLLQCESHPGRLAQGRCQYCGRLCCLSCGFESDGGMRCPEHLEGGPGLSAAGVFGRLVFFGFSLLPLVGLFLGGFLILRGWPQDRPLGQICMAASVFLYMVLSTLVLAIFGATGLSALIRIMLPA